MNIQEIAKALVLQAQDELMDAVELQLEAEEQTGVKPTSARMDQIETDLLREVLKAMTVQINAEEVAHQNAPREDGF